MESQALLEKLYGGHTLTAAESEILFNAIMSDALSNEQIAAMLIALKVRGETIDEVNGAVLAAMKNTKPFPTPDYPFWKAISVDVKHKSAVNFDDVSEVDRFIFDSKSGTQQGGTGATFDWSLIPQELKYKIILAGGISPSNIEDALVQHCAGVDLNSGVESAPGVKDAEKVRSVFAKIL
ncbi:hypothetical protein [Aggregatibacter actinomycetemcomitans]|uniref:phosphoribosylanthranilate isomerase n=1 Tax=Aggregatibacter actinomycetemcomitans TaxID=714 RepID=UPI0011DC3C36|nr:hypothetical protein FXE10_06895 [Aggregatibacter actinomycetemcomitans]TYA32422.1 hypothetical protein FXB69_07755 [Aggregatibacter actinomycetemcomitans]TYA99831.1 hypothetical protein FXB93_07070 [Aggregatibacter actinomycetemcomitans]TYB14616.1 hypothetical protein FXB65_06965 [Aggregatibacter actinomycetemcomitans]TYB15777.1 hypothetical protein FXB76_06325 [Aggregatibacter actinomycetemcomitans]